MNSTATTTIDATPDEVFGLVTNLDRLPEWNRAIVGVVDRPEALAPDRQWVVELRALGQKWRSRSTVESIDRTARRFVYRTQTDDGNPSWARWDWTVADDPAGSRVTVRWEIHPATFWRRVLFAHVRNRQLARTEVPSSLAALRAVLQATKTP